MYSGACLGSLLEMLLVCTIFLHLADRLATLSPVEILGTIAFVWWWADPIQRGVLLDAVLEHIFTLFVV